MVPESVKRLAAKKVDVSIESGAGAASFAADDEYRAAGARVDASLGALLADADAVLQIRPPTVEEIKQLKEGSTLVSLLFPLVNHALVRALAARNVTAVAVDMIPRTTLAQMMDVLSSQATAAGYEAVLMAATALPRFFPMLMTAAGTIAPAKVLVLGAGVAGLQAIGTAQAPRRRGRGLRRPQGRQGAGREPGRQVRRGRRDRGRRRRPAATPRS